MSAEVELSGVRMKTSVLSCLVLATVLVCGCAPDSPNASPAVNSGGTTANQPAANQPSKPDPQPQPEVKPDKAPDTGPQNEADYVAFEGGLRAYPEKNVVEMDAWLLGSQTRPLEYLLVSPGGNTHESLFATAASGLHLKRALEIIGLQEGEIKRAGRGYLDKPTGDRVKISVRFYHMKTGEETTARVEDWLWDHNTDANPTPVGWIFNGSFEQYRENINRSIFEADMKGNLIGMWRDASCVLDNDRDDAYMPDIYSPHPEAEGIPKAVRGVTPEVTLIFEPMNEEQEDE